MKTKFLALSALLLGCTFANAGTYTWTGAAGDGLFYSAGNWNYDGAPAAAAPARNTTDDIVISGVGAAVTYVPGGDFEPYGTVTISDGASFTQAEKTSYMKIHGALMIDGGTFDTGTTGAIQLDGDVVVSNGGVFAARKAPSNQSGSARIVLRDGGTMYHIVGANWNSRDRPQLVLDGGSAYIGHENGTRNFVPDGTDDFRSGKVVLGGQMQPPQFFELAGDVTFECAKFAPQTAGSVQTFRAGRLVATGTSDNGFWQNNGNSANGAYIDVTPGSTAVFTFNMAVEDVYSKTFGSNASKPKFRYDGTILSTADFARLFTVEESTDYAGFVDFYLTPASADAPSFVDNAVAATLVSPTEAVLTATVDSPGIPAAGLVAMWGHADQGHDIGSWDNVLDLGTASAGALQATLALTPNRRYYYRLAATNEVGEAWASPNPASFISADIPLAPTNTWTGAVSSDSRDPDNWSLGHVPTAGETVFVLDLLAQNPLDWWPGTGTDEVAGWIQPAEFENANWTVWFHTTPEAGLAVTGDVSLGAGIWTHEGPSATPTNAVNVTVGGNFTLGSQAKIFAGNGATNSEEGRARGYYNAGPGYTAGLAGASFAGDGGCTSVVSFVSYGSILDPREHGSSGLGDNLGFSGAGVILLDVAGALTADGTIAAIGHGWNGATGKGASTGGSINLVAGSLTGTGSISADGGQDTSVGSGSGGRIAIRLMDAGADFASAPAITANGRGGTASGATSSAAGTIYLQTAADGEGSGTVRVSNPALASASDETLPSAATHLPAMQDADSAEALKASNWELSGHGALRLTADCRVASLALSNTNGAQRVYTDGHTLRVNALTIAGTALHGTQTAATLPAIVAGNGSIVVDDATMVILIR